MTLPTFISQLFVLCVQHTTISVSQCIQLYVFQMMVDLCIALTDCSLNAVLLDKCCCYFQSVCVYSKLHFIPKYNICNAKITLEASSIVTKPISYCCCGGGWASFSSPHSISTSIIKSSIINTTFALQGASIYL